MSAKPVPQTCGLIRPETAQSGQALVFGMLLAAAAALVLIRYFFAGQVVAAKARQLHVLDATAYSGALIQARALNMLAYINRAQIGHQVAMAHLVTLGSWAAFGGTQSRQLASGNPPSYLIGLLFGPEYGAAYMAAGSAGGTDAMARTDGELARAYAAHDRLVHEVFSSVQQAITDGVPDARQAAMQAVLKQNYPDHSESSFDLSITDDTWSGYVRTYSGRQELRPLIQEIVDLYTFLGPRNHTARNPWVVDARCPMLRHELRRRGNTEFDVYGRWQSIDTQSFHALRSNRWIGCYFREYPMAWGWIPTAAVQNVTTPHVDNPPDDFAAQDFWRWVRDATNWDIHSGDANPLANSRAVVNRQRWLGGGLPNYFDIGTSTKTPGLRFAVDMRYPGPEGVVLSSRSAAETFFERPEPRADGRTEAENLFHPYWQARLVAPGVPGPNSAGQP